MKCLRYLFYGRRLMLSVLTACNFAIACLEFRTWWQILTITPFILWQWTISNWWIRKGEIGQSFSGLTDPQLEAVIRLKANRQSNFGRTQADQEVTDRSAAAADKNAFGRP